MIDLSKSRVCVTGGAGFLGQQIVAQLVKAKCRYVSIPRSYDYDLRQKSHVMRMLEDHRPDIVIHAAAQAGGIGLNREKPAELFYNNAIMGINVMHESYEYGVKKFVQIGTVCAYPKYTEVPFLEESLWNGYPEETNAPYGLAKKMLLVQAQAYRRQYGFNAIYLLPVNLYGPHDNFDEDSSHVIPALIRKFVEAKKKNRSSVTLWGSGSASREFLYVEDCARAIVAATQRYDRSEPVNVGAGTEIKIAKLVELIASIVGFKGLVFYDNTKPDGQPRRCLDVNRAHMEFGFEARVKLEEGLRRTINWYLKESK